MRRFLSWAKIENVVILEKLKGKNALIFLSGIFLASFFSGFFSFHFFLSKTLWGDHIFLLLTAKTFISGGSFFNNESLGYPGTFTWLGFPYSDYSQRLLLLIAATVSKNAVVSTNLYYLLTVLLIFSSSYFVVFKYTKNNYFALFGSLMFVLTPYMVVRSTGHDFLAAYYCVPWAFYLFYEISRWSPGPVTLRDFRFFFRISILLSLVVLATSGVYYTAFSGMFLIAAGLFLSLKRRSLQPVYLGVLSTAIILVFLVMAFSPFLLYLAKEHIHTPHRSFTEQPLVGARISDILWTLGNYFRNPYLQSYSEWRSSPSQFPEGYDFWPGVVLSTFSLVSILFIPYLSRRNVVEEREDKGPAENPPDCDLLLVLSSYVVLLLLTAVPYGLGLIFNFLFTPDIRNYNRLSPFFSFASILLLVVFLKTVGTKVTFVSRYGNALMALVFLLNCYPFFWFVSKTQESLLHDNLYLSEMKSIGSTLSTIHRFHLKRIYQGPNIYWPEAPTIQRFDSYDHALLYVFDKNKSQVKWSYGLMSNAPEYHILSSIEAEKNRKESVVKLSCLGFDGIVLEKRGYSKEALEGWSRGVENVSGDSLIYSDPMRLVFVLAKPSDDDCRKQSLFPTNQWLSTKEGGEGASFLLRGWGNNESWGTWGIGPSQSIFLPVAVRKYARTTVLVDAQALLTDRKPSRTVFVSANGIPVSTLLFTRDRNAGEWAIVIPRQVITKKKIVLVFSTRHPLSPDSLGIGRGDLRPISFGITRFKVCLDTRSRCSIK